MASVFVNRGRTPLPQQPLGTAPLQLKLLLPHADPFGSVATFLQSGPHMLSLLTGSVDVRILDLSSSAHSESGKSLGAYTPSPAPGAALLVTDRGGCVSTPALSFLNLEVGLWRLYSSPCKNEPNSPSVGRSPHLPFAVCLYWLC